MKKPPKRLDCALVKWGGENSLARLLMYANWEKIFTNAPRDWDGGWCLRRRRAGWFLILRAITTKCKTTFGANVRIADKTEMA
jgi:hypothetical protein